MKPRYAAAFALVAAGCAVTGASFEPVSPQPNQAVIYVYRPYSYNGSLVSPAVACGSSMAHVGPGGYHPFKVRSGPLKCAVGNNSVELSCLTASGSPLGVTECAASAGSEVQLEVEPGSTSYVKEERASWLAPGPRLYQMDAEAAEPEIQSCCKLSP